MIVKKKIPKSKPLRHAENFTKTRAKLAKTEDADLSEVSIFQQLLSDVLSRHYDNPDAKDRAIYDVVEKGILDLLPVAEKHYREVKTDRAMTPLDKLILQLRDVLNESKKLRELETQHVKIITMIESSFRSLLEAFVDEAHVFKTTLKSDLSRTDYKAVDAALTRLIDSQRGMVRELMLTLSRDVEGYFKAPVASSRSTRRK